MASIVFDASAILALLRDEPGADVVAQYIGDGLIPAVNLQELIKGLLRREVPIDAAVVMLNALHLDVRPHGRDDAIAAAKLYPVTKEFGSGLGDRTCMALAISEGIPVLTADREWARIESRASSFCWRDDGSPWLTSLAMPGSAPATRTSPARRCV